jgi:sarcosine dehydrogenase
VTREFVESGRYEVEVAWQKVPARARLSPFYDPRMTRVRA